MSIINTFPSAPSLVSPTNDGLMSKEDKINLENLILKIEALEKANTEINEKLKSAVYYTPNIEESIE